MIGQGQTIVFLLRKGGVLNSVAYQTCPKRVKHSLHYFSAFHQFVEFDPMAEQKGLLWHSIYLKFVLCHCGAKEHP